MHGADMDMVWVNPWADRVGMAAWNELSWVQLGKQRTCSFGV